MRITVSLETGCWDSIIMAFPMDWVTEVSEIRFELNLFIYFPLKQTWLRFKLPAACGMLMWDVVLVRKEVGYECGFDIYDLWFMACFKLHLLWSFPGMIMIMFYPWWFLNILFLFVTFSEDCEKLLRKPDQKLLGRWGR